MIPQEIKSNNKEINHSNLPMQLTLTAINMMATSHESKMKMINSATIQEECIAQVVAENLYNEIIAYQNNLPETEDVAMSVVKFNESITLLVDSIGYIGYNLIRFGGKDSLGKPMELIQHVSQLNFLLMVVPKSESEVPKRQIGFVN